MPRRSTWERLKSSRLAQVLLVYLGISWAVVQVVSDLTGMLSLPEWIGPVTIILLGVGLIVMLATAWVQSHPLIDAREDADEVPSSWELDLGDAVRSVRGGRMPHLTWSRALVGGAAAFVLLFAIGGAYVMVRDGAGPRPDPLTAAEAPHGIAVLPFSVTGADEETWGDGMVDLLSAGLDGAAGLRSISSRSIFARWNESVRGDAAADEGVALDVARRLGARYAMLGSAVAIGPNVRLSAQIYEFEPDGVRRLDVTQTQGHPDSVLALVDQLGRQTLAIILRTDRDLPRLDLASVTTSSLPALKSFLAGEALFRAGSFEEAAVAFEQAVTTDSLFALAHWRMSQALGWNENFQSPRGLEAHERAAHLADRLPPREALLVRATRLARDGDSMSVVMLKEAVRMYPDDAEAWYQLGDAHLHVPAALGGWDEASAAFERAMALAPRMASYRIHPLEMAFRQDADSALARQRLEELRAIAPTSPHVERYALISRILFGDDETADAAIEEALRRPDGGASLTLAVRHPRVTERGRRFAAAAMERAQPEIRRQIAMGTAAGEFYLHGKLDDALRAIRAAGLGRVEEAAFLVGTAMSAVPIDPAVVDSAAAVLNEAVAAGAGPTVTPPPVLNAILGAYAAERGRWTEYEQRLSRLESLADSLRQEGDTTDAKRVSGEAANLRGFGYSRRGQTDAALAAFAEARAAGASYIALWFGALTLMDAGRFDDAALFLRTYMKWDIDPLGAYQLGRAYQAAGNAGPARAAFSSFIEAWQDADPQFQPMVEDARQRLASLSPDAAR